MARERWDKRSAFIMAAIGSAIGLGNVWRFPYMAYANGGGAFFIPYIIALITTGVPLVSLEYYIGTRSQKGPSEAYGFFKKKTNYIGWTAIGVSTMITIYYAVIMGWAWLYLFKSIGVKWLGNSKGFFYNDVLGLSSGIGTIGGIQWPIVLGTLLTWIAIFLIIFKGVKVVGKVVNWTVGLPWALLLILIIRGITLKGAGMGLDYYLRPDFHKLLDPNVWLAAYGQIFFSLSLGFGIMIAYASYLPEKSDIHTNSWVVSFANCATSFFAGFAIFSVLGYLAVQTGQPVDKVVASGPGLAFVVYPTAIATLPGGIVSQSIFGIAFFFMLLTLGIDSAFSLVEAVVTSLKDSFNFKRETTAAVVCIIGFLAGVIYMTSAGLYYLDVVDHWMNWGLVIVGLMEAILFGWFLDTKKLSADMDATSSIKLGNFWIFSIKWLTPIVLLITIISSIIKEIKTPYGGYPIWALMGGGWVLLIGLFFLSIYLQNRNDMKNISVLWLRVIGAILSFAGSSYSFYLYYQHTGYVTPSLVLAGAVIVGLVTLVFIKSPKREVV